MVTDKKSQETEDSNLDLEDTNVNQLEEPIKEIVPPEKLEFKQILDKEIGLIKILDYLSHSALDLIHQEKLMEKYRNEIIRPLIGVKGEESEYLDGGRLFLQEEYEKLNVEKNTDDIINAAEELAAENGITRHVQKTISIYTMVIMAVTMVIFIAINTWVPDIGSYIMIPLMLVFCIAPQLIRSLMMKKWHAFKNEHDQELNESQSEKVGELKIFIQDLIDDTRDRLISNKVSVKGIQFVLYSKDYDNIVFVHEQQVQAGSGKQFVIRFLGLEGEEQEDTISTYGKSGIPEDDENDQFIILKNARFNDESILTEYDASFLPRDEDEFIEALLGGSKFNDVDNPEYIIPNFKSYNDIKCKCGESILFQGLKTCESILHKNYEYYLIIGKKCEKCNTNPFILFNSPGNKEIPSGLSSIFL